MGKSELETLREKVEELEQYEDQQDRIEDLEEEVRDLESQLPTEQDDEEKVPFDISSLPNQMKWEKLCENWDYITLDDIDAICKS